MTHCMAIAVSRVLEGYALEPKIKWPNDVLVEGQKIAGVLAEGRWQGGQSPVVALGLGVNLNMSVEDAACVDVPVCVLAHALGQPVDRDVFAEAVLAAFSSAVMELERLGPQAMRREMAERLWSLDETVEVRVPTGVVRGCVRGINDRGALVLTDGDGHTHSVFAGDVAC